VLSAAMLIIWGLLINAVWGWIALILSIVIWPRFTKDKKMAADLACSAAHAEWQTLLQKWQSEASKILFTNKLDDLQRKYTMSTCMPKERRARIAQLESNREKLQRKAYLDQFLISRASIRGIGPNRSSTLKAYGIVSAADIVSQKILNITGFSGALTTELVGWRRLHESRFRFNPSEAEYRKDIDALDRELEKRLQASLSELKQGAETLERLGEEINISRRRLIPLMEEAWNTLMIAKENRKALRIWNF